jgi:hypothetical protein
MPYNEKTKQSIYNWRENNREQYDDYMNVKSKELYEKNKRYNWDKSNGRRRYLTEAKRFRNILL